MAALPPDDASTPLLHVDPSTVPPPDPIETNGPSAPGDPGDRASLPRRDSLLEDLPLREGESGLPEEGSGVDPAEGDPPDGLQLLLREGQAVAHDLNNVLTAILGYADLAMATLPPDDPAYDDVERIRKAGERGRGLNGHFRRLIRDAEARGLSSAARGERDGEVRDDAAGGKTVLLVEDEGLVRSLAERILTRQGYRVIAAQSGNDALDRMDEFPVLDLVLSDVVLPGMSGPEIVARLRGEGRGFRVLYMSGYSPEHLTALGVRAEGPEFLAKPFDPEILASRVRQLLDA